MSYFPDYRKETDKLNEVDKASVTGFRIAAEVASNCLDEFIKEMPLTVAKEVGAMLKARLEEWLECEEISFVYSLFDNADYLPEDTELVDANKE